MDGGAANGREGPESVFRKSVRIRHHEMNSGQALAQSSFASVKSVPTQEYSIFIPSRIERALYVDSWFLQYMRINHGCLHIFMP